MFLGPLEIIVVVGAIVLSVVLIMVMRTYLITSRSARTRSQAGELADLWEEVAQLREEVERLKKGRSATRSRDIKPLDMN